MEYMKLNISLFRCHDKKVGGSMYDFSHMDHAFNTETNDDTAKDPLIKNVLGENLYSSFQTLFGYHEENTKSRMSATVRTREEAVNPCERIVSTFEVTFNPEYVWLWCLSLAVIGVLLLIIVFIIMPKIKRRLTELKGKSKENEMPNDVKEQMGVIETISTVNIVPVNSSISIVPLNSSVSVEENSTKSKLESSKSSKPIKVYYKPYTGKRPTLSETDIHTVLEETTGKLISKLDRLLLKGASSLDQTQSSIATPRLARHTLVRRQRVGSSPILLPGQSDESVGNTVGKSKSWKEFNAFHNDMQINRTKDFNFPMDALDVSSQKLVQYFHRVCPIDENILEATSLISSYALFLLKSELENMTGQSSSMYRFLKFLPTGSNKYGTKVSRINSLDFLMVVQLPFKVEEMYFESKSSPQISPGMIVLSCDKDSTRKASERSGLTQCEIDGNVVQCISAKRFLQGAEELVVSCLQNLYTRIRSDMDKLPITIKRSPTANLQVTIDSRAIVGLGEPEIKVNIVPVVSLVTGSLYQTPVLFATPRCEENELKPSSENKALCHDCFWKVLCEDFEWIFIDHINRLQSEHGNMCHEMCLMILKALLTDCGRKNLLDRGMFQSRHISTVLYLLLLESEPEQWAFNKLADRFSDILHFLQEAYKTGLLPAFFFNNQHLANKMAAVAGNPVLMRKGQLNLLADVRRDSLEKCLVYMKDRIREAGLTDCVKEEYSPDMWEYEFFLFN
ncbi:uncharacterized protein LOC127841765 [Dreissena polymorpha]|uniref:Mab-21-like HhH/H2TH-like domain-containing protein n=1 Tax=Dreissena polymorpha TaxID=45954 RepID=A0A9D4EPV0_DREPO|nr:uncharacterized protein LOC127841765 [Dreissena polymorpha]KAH3781817.1 hypothetical protein DPMN_159724 [Dreissena polymorpha]